MIIFVLVVVAAIMAGAFVAYRLAFWPGREHSARQLHHSTVTGARTI